MESRSFLLENSLSSNNLIKVRVRRLPIKHPKKKIELKQKELSPQSNISIKNSTSFLERILPTTLIDIRKKVRSRNGDLQKNNSNFRIARASSNANIKNSTLLLENQKSSPRNLGNKIREKLFFNSMIITGETRFNKSNYFFLKTLQQSNGFVTLLDKFFRFKYFIAPGNNSELVTEIMRNRLKWKRVNSYVKANFIWTPWLNISVLSQLGVKEDTHICVTKFATKNASIFPEDFAYKIFPIKELNLHGVKIYNKLPRNFELTNKKELYYNMFEYYNKKKIHPFSKIPLTYHIKSGLEDPNFKEFYSKFAEIRYKGLPNYWIIKPAENTNCGFGIKVCSQLDEVVDIINEFSKEGSRTVIIQKYIENPLLYLERKFDIRCYALVTAFQNNIQGYFYKEGYIRTCAEKFSLKNVKNKFIHLTNDAVQKFSTQYGKFENANKLSYADLQEYLESFNQNIDFYSQILPQIKGLVLDSIIATHEKLNPDKKVQCFEIFGYDFMIDSNLKVWLIEVNTNPCIELVSSYLETLIPKMLENAFALTVDQFFFGNSYIQNDFEMIFNQASYI